MPEFAQVLLVLLRSLLLCQCDETAGRMVGETGELGVPNLRLQLLWLEGFFHGPWAWFFQIGVREAFVAPGVVLGV